MIIIGYLLQVASTVAYTYFCEPKCKSCFSHSSDWPKDNLTYWYVPPTAGKPNVPFRKIDLISPATVMLNQNTEFVIVFPDYIL